MHVTLYHLESGPIHSLSARLMASNPFQSVICLADLYIPLLTENLDGGPESEKKIQEEEEKGKGGTINKKLEQMDKKLCGGWLMRHKRSVKERLIAKKHYFTKKLERLKSAPYRGYMHVIPGFRKDYDVSYQLSTSTGPEHKSPEGIEPPRPCARTLALGPWLSNPNHHTNNGG